MRDTSCALYSKTGYNIKSFLDNKKITKEFSICCGGRSTNIWKIPYVSSFFFESFPEYLRYLEISINSKISLSWRNSIIDSTTFGFISSQHGSKIIVFLVDLSIVFFLLSFLGYLVNIPFSKICF